MLVLVTYDVNTESPTGQSRLRKVAKACQDYGQRVQNSVFECVVDSGQLLKMKDRLVKLIDPTRDSLRFYVMGNDKGRVEHYGVRPSCSVIDPLIL